MATTLREEYKLQVFGIKMLRKTFKPKWVEVSNLAYIIMRNFVIYTGCLVLLG
jgi:hypothetical protein